MRWVEGGGGRWREDKLVVSPSLKSGIGEGNFTSSAHAVAGGGRRESRFIARSAPKTRSASRWHCSATGGNSHGSKLYDDRGVGVPSTL